MFLSFFCSFQFCCRFFGVYYKIQATKAMKNPNPSKAFVKGKRPASWDNPASTKKRKVGVSEVSFFLCFVFPRMYVCFAFVSFFAV